MRFALHEYRKKAKEGYKCSFFTSVPMYTSTCLGRNYIFLQRKLLYLFLSLPCILEVLYMLGITANIFRLWAWRQNFVKGFDFIPVIFFMSLGKFSCFRYIVKQEICIPAKSVLFARIKADQKLFCRSSFHAK